MRKTFFAALAAALAVLGCQKGPQVPVDHLEFSSESPETRTVCPPILYSLDSTFIDCKDGHNL